MEAKRNGGGAGVHGEGLSPAARGAVRRACEILDAHPDERISLAELADRVGRSPWNLQRLFRQSLGLSPREYAESRRHGRLKKELRHRSVTHALYEAGYSSPSRIYDRSKQKLGMTPATYKRGGRGAAIRYVTAPSPLGLLLVAATRHGICRVTLGESKRQLAHDLRAEFPEADVAAGGPELERLARRVVRLIRGEAPNGDLPLDLRATAFQWRVYKELLAIPRGQTRSYKEVAERVGNPKGARAVARVCATNPAPFIVPCHRVVASDGTLGGYGFGLRKKAQILSAEEKASGSK